MPDDEISRTARQVRGPEYRAVTHTVTTTSRSPALGNCYTTGCGRTLTVTGKAVLTTQPVTCQDCMRRDRLAVLDETARKALKRRWSSSTGGSAE